MRGIKSTQSFLDDRPASDAPHYSLDFATTLTHWLRSRSKACSSLCATPLNRKSGWLDGLPPVFMRYSLYSRRSGKEAIFMRDNN
jgi:hypothetical protein